MTEQGKKYLSDVLHAIDLIEQFTESTANFHDFQNDIKTQSAVERQLGIIGEAIHKFDQLFPDNSIENAGRIIGFRNRIIHGYDTVDISIVWTILKRHLNPLKEEVFKKMGTSRKDY